MTRAGITLALLLAASPAFAQIEECPFFKRQIDALVAGEANAAVNVLDPGQGARCYALYVAGGDELVRASFQQFVKRFETSRSDKQASGTTTASAATSVVPEGAAAKILSVAAEYGALTKDVKGQVITIRGNLAGLPAALVNHGIFPYCVGPKPSNSFCEPGSMLSILRRISFGASFDASRDNQVVATPSATGGSGSTQPVTFTASKNELAAFSARAELWKPQRDTSSPQFVEAWTKKVGEAMNATSGDLLLRAGAFYTDIVKAQGFDAWRTKHLALVRAAAVGGNREAIVAAVKTALSEFLTFARSVEGFDDHADAALLAYDRFFLAQDELLDSLTPTALAFEYANNRPTGQPATTDLRVILDLPIASKTRLVFTGGATLYDDPSSIAATGASRLRDAIAAAQLDQSLGKTSLTGPIVVSLAGYYQRQNSPAVLNVDPLNPVPGVTFVGLPSDAKTVFATTGNIVLGQGKLTFVPPGSGVKIPLSITYSNRTELIDKPTWRGQVGVAFDVDGLFAGR